ncbi:MULTISPECIES: zinc ABC transporter permease subunit ZnuB [Nitrospirillum]|uniref:High-affinity zinc uptake system membrane protein ZnuB n=1 Tax=Nitrospirillum amazonense TaxID=28077 RepID=A0A560FB80_9PROT|nr:zinc ABC transporter permease subunit ZnuB [Nitrospirillum amazonense]MEC4595035.1 zinc ABC transporter permease subunit ZnuB [Nitrospirillum amazonense]TWB18862.1 zinc transport system permease protein [Nitrospirillum amazonense]
MDDFLLRALAGGVGVALVAGPLGCFVVWRRMAYFGDTLSHAALLGIALGFVAGINLMLAVALVGLALAGVLVLMQRQRKLATDTLLGLLSHTTLSLGLIAVALLQTVRVDLMSYLFGDILAVSGGDLAWIWGGGAVVLALLAWLWRPLLAMTVNEDLARVEGVPVLATQLGFMMLMAATIALAMKVVGVLLITALLIIPAACARRFARTPEIMAGLAAAIGALSVCGGLGASFRADLPAGPAVVVAAAALFLLSQLFPRGGPR